MLWFLGLLYLGLPVVCWAVLVRTRVIGVTVLVVLAGLAFALFGLEREWYFTRATAELEIGYPLVTGLVLLAGGLAEQRLRGPRPAKETDHRLGGSIAAVTAHVLAGIVLAVGYRLLSYDAFLPSAAEVPPPPGLTVTHVDPGYCGSNFCSRTLAFGSTAGLPPAEIEARLRATLTADGWTPGPNGSLVHPHGWLLDDRLSQAYVTGATVELSGSESVNAAR
ncbi:hypothetical protein [Kitasatospora sp. NPDC089509]|uniref:hypothetical protein n=1 Tax=Kitasatospora sp. NPDC089509 TaxID=3364079 RepID=UPI00381FBF8F